jgi:flagellar protein FliJ
VQRSRQLKTARHVLERDERHKAETLAMSERQLRESEAKLAELQAYRSDYLRDFSRRAGSGINAASARSYQAFLTRLDAALREQTELVSRARAQRAEQLIKWRGAAQRSAALERVTKRYRSEEQGQAERREQSESDERAQRTLTSGANRRARQ